MEVDCKLTFMQGCFISLQKTVGTLTNIEEGNDKAIEEVVKVLLKEAESEKFSKKDFQRLFLVLFMNTEKTYCEKLIDEESLSHVFGFIPKISKWLFINIVFSLHLEEFLYDSIIYFKSDLCEQVVDICMESFKVVDLFESVKFIENIAVSIFSKLLILKDGSYKTTFKHKFQDLFLHYDGRENITNNKLMLLKKKDLYHYSGRVMCSMLNMVEKCTKLLCGIEKIELNENSLFHLLKEVNKETSDIRLNSTALECYEILVSKCSNNICDITVDVWLYWVEIDAPEIGNTLQRLVAERAYTCREALNEVKINGISLPQVDSLTEKLINIAAKPHMEEDEIKQADIETIINNIRDPSKKQNKWLKALLSEQNLTLERDVLNTVKEYLFLFDKEDVCNLLQIVVSNVSKGPENSNELKQLALDSMIHLNLDTQINILHNFVKGNGFITTLSTENFRSVLIETFNKIVMSEDKVSQFYPTIVRLSLQSGKEVIIRAVSDGVINENRRNLMVDVLSMLKPLCNSVDIQVSDKPILPYVLNDCFNKTELLSDNQKCNLPIFIKRLAQRGLISSRNFIIDFVFPSLLNSNWKRKQIDLDVLLVLLDTDHNLNITCILLFLMQILEHSRWHINSFSENAVSVCEKVIKCINTLINMCLDTITEAEKKFLKAQTNSFKSLNKIHLRKLFALDNVPTDNKLVLYAYNFDTVKGFDVDGITVLNLIQILPVSTESEWQGYFQMFATETSNFFLFLNAVSDSLKVLGSLCDDKTDINVKNCLAYCVRNLALIVMNNMPKDCSEFNALAFCNICQVIEKLPKSQQAESFTLFMKLLIQLLKSVNLNSPTPETVNLITSGIASVEDPKHVRKLSKILKNKLYG